MSYIGNTNTTQAFTPAVDYFSGNASTTAFTLSRPVASVAQVQVVVNNVAQNPSDAYTVSVSLGGGIITFTSAPSSGTNNIYVYYTSPITQVIAPGQGTVTTTSLATNFTLPVANGGTGLTAIPHTVGVIYSGSGTYTTPANVKAIWVRIVGGGGGGGGNQNGADGTGGGNTTFGTLTANGGAGGKVGGTAGTGSGGTASNGDLSVVGGGGGGSFGPALYATPGGVGGNSAFGGGGAGGFGATGLAGATNSGGGGGGGGGNGASRAAGGGGGAGGYVEKLIAPPTATYSYAVGASGAAGAGGDTNGGAGGSGVIIVEEFYV